MAYVERNNKGNIIGVFKRPQYEGQEKIDDSLVESQKEPKPYHIKRKEQYPSIQEQLEMMYEDRVNGTNTWEEAIRAVREAHPKPRK